MAFLTANHNKILYENCQLKRTERDELNVYGIHAGKSLFSNANEFNLNAESDYYIMYGTSTEPAVFITIYIQIDLYCHVEFYLDEHLIVTVIALISVWICNLNWMIW